MVLLTGDSMSGALMAAFKKRIEAAGGHFYCEPWYSSTTIQWAESKKLTELIEAHKPDIVFIALGSNEIFIPNLGPRAEAVKSIAGELDTLPGYWIGPPSWKPDQGIVKTIEANFPPGHFCNSNNLDLPRRRDGAHPTVEGSEQWAVYIWDWFSQVY
jgi:lysophospholipase L1-like esterase